MLTAITRERHRFIMVTPCKSAARQVAADLFMRVYGARVSAEWPACRGPACQRVVACKLGSSGTNPHGDTLAPAAALDHRAPRGAEPLPAIDRFRAAEPGGLTPSAPGVSVMGGIDCGGLDASERGTVAQGHH